MLRAQSTKAKHVNAHGPHGLTFTWWGCYGLCPSHTLTELAHSFYSVLVFISVFMALFLCLFLSLWPFFLCLFLSLWPFFLCLFLSYGPFTCISLPKFSRQLSSFSLCSCGLLSALLVLSTLYLCVKVSFQTYG